MIARCAIPLFVAALVFSGCARTPQPEASSTVEKEDEIYIPKDLDDCFVQLKKLLKPEDVEKMKSGTEDDMSGIILDSFWRHLNQKPIKLDEQVKYYQDYWKKHETIQQPDSGDLQ